MTSLLIFQVERGFAVGVVANATVKGRYGAIRIGANLRGNLRVRYAAARDFDSILWWEVAIEFEDQPPLTGGETPPHHPQTGEYLQTANSRLRAATSDARNLRSSGRAAQHGKRGPQ